MNKDGVEFKCSFLLKVKNKQISTAKNGKKYIGFNLIPIDCIGQDKMAWCHNYVSIHKELSVLGPLESSYRDGKFSLSINAQTMVDVQLYENEEWPDSSATPAMQKELPYN